MLKVVILTVLAVQLVNTAAALIIDSEEKFAYVACGVPAAMLYVIISVIRKAMKAYRKANYKALKQLRRIIDNENINLIHCHNPMGAVTARLAAKCSHKNPYVMYTAHGFHFYQGAPVKNWLLFYMAEKFARSLILKANAMNTRF